MMRKKALTPLAAAIILIAGLIYNFGGVEKDQVKQSEPGTNVTVAAPEQLMNVKNEGLGPNKFIYAQVTKVVDGDTLEVNYKNKEYKVRLLCVDTPESVKQGVSVQPYGKEASEFLKTSVMGKKVKLVFEKGLRDRYGRVLAHVLTENDTHINSMLIRNGYARVEIVSPNRAFKDYFFSLQETALQEKKGFWALPEAERPFVKNNKGMYVPSYQVKKEAS
jgi:micrococcal nuclease